MAMEDIQNAGSLDEIQPALDAESGPESELIQFAYRHKRVRNFIVGDFEFKNNVLVIGPGPKDEVLRRVAEFKKLYAGLHNSDRMAIVQIRNVENEIPIEERAPSQIVRGAVSSVDVSDKPVGGTGVDPAKATPNNSGLQSFLGVKQPGKAGA